MANRSKVNLNWLDRVAGFVSPKWASNRLAWRAYHQEALAFTSSRSGGYRGATNSRLDKSTTSLAIGESGPDELTLARLRDRSRRLERDNVLGSSMLSRAVDNVVGSGMKLQATTPDPEFNKRAEELWRSWWHEQPESRGQFTGPQLERLVVRSRNRDGDVGAILLKSGQIQMVE
ncbi:MAG: phage portal protein, partial [Mycobacterium sp.]